MGVDTLLLWNYYAVTDQNSTLVFASGRQFSVGALNNFTQIASGIGFQIVFGVVGGYLLFNSPQTVEPLYQYVGFLGADWPVNGSEWAEFFSNFTATVQPWAAWAEAHRQVRNRNTGPIGT